MGVATEHGNLIEAVSFNSIWDCVNCGACQEQCPVYIEHVPALMTLDISFLLTSRSRGDSA